MAKRKAKQKILGWKKGNYCPDCGQKVHHISRALPPYSSYIWIVHHFFANRNCFHIDETIPPLLKENFDRLVNNAIKQDALHSIPTKTA